MLAGGPGGALILRCFYCDHRLKVQLVGHVNSKRYCAYDIALAATIQGWFKKKQLAIFDSLKQAEELGYEPYKRGATRVLMDASAISSAISEIARQVMQECQQPERLLILGIRTKGSFLAQRVTSELAAEHKLRVEVGEIEIYGTGEEIRRVSASDADAAPLNLKDREIILVDDVLYTGRTVSSALSMIFRSGRPRSVRLAVLIDRGHRQVPVKPNYVGKHIPSSEEERVRVRLRESGSEPVDQVTIYAMINANEIDDTSNAAIETASDNVKAES
jgi:pyrimidine operon attenuation protein/uracil phosphoribosyltransferase